ncbi:MAG: phosphoribosylformylglycinamidine synthase subunit PurQ, partial [Oscillospiraceae bacterium]|nr:phosphoribosylformylglycinamidine synthase subunit PurQ [Oscillospiraceae bacterium]
VDLSREFLNSNGAKKTAAAYIPVAAPPPRRPWETANTPAEGWLLLASDLNYCSQRGLAELFDSSAGACGVLAPHGGAAMQTPAQCMAALLPAEGAATASVMAFGFDPYLSEADPFGGAAHAVVTSLAKIVAAGVSPDTAYLTFQEYFPRPGGDPERWGLPAAALLGALEAQMGLGIASVGGKDSMSGSYETLDVPPALVSFAVGTARAGDILTPEFKAPGNPVYLFSAPPGPDGMPDYAALRALWTRFIALCREGRVLSAWALETGGVSGAVIKMMLGNGIGFAFDDAFDGFFDLPWGGLIAECTGPVEGARLAGHTQSRAELTQRSSRAPLESLRAAWEAPLEGVFPTRAGTVSASSPASGGQSPPPKIESALVHTPYRGPAVSGRPLAVIPAFPGANGELDAARAVERAGGRAEVVVIRNLKPEWIGESAARLCEALKRAQMLILPGGFSGSISGSYIVSFFQNPRAADAVRALLAADGLVLGICNGFQALLKLGLVPYGDLRAGEEPGPALTANLIGRHRSRYVRLRAASALSPWLSEYRPGEVYLTAASHGKGRFTAPPECLERLRANGQIAMQYCDASGVPGMDIADNPNGSDWAVEAISSPDGRVLGKMAHSERAGVHLAKNIPGRKEQPLFEGGIKYFL